MPETENISATALADNRDIFAESDFGWALYRFPGSKELNFTGGEVIESSIETKPSAGFVIAPFYQPDKQLWFIENQLQFLLDDTEFLSLEEALPLQYSDNKNIRSGSESGYIKLVELVIAEIEKGNMQKAVPARLKQGVLKSDFSAFSFLKSLLDAYPNAFVYLLSTPRTGTWIGCTPEMLLKRNDDTIQTLSLAGTKKSGNIDSGAFSSKETEEQAIVTRYIYEILQKYCSDIETDGPRIITAGNVNHIATYFTGTLRSDFQDNILQIIKGLHPTPAVCGMPLEVSRDFLLQHEDFDRSLYSGFLGPVSETKADLFVNLRCMQVFRDSAALYAGAGVVRGSVPENEWMETEEKMNTLQKFL